MRSLFKHLALASLALITILTTFSHAGGPVRSNENIEGIITSENVEEFLKDFSGQLAKSAPMQMDSVTTLDSAYSIGTTLYVRYGFDKYKFIELFIADFEKELGAETAEYFYGHKNFAEYLDNVLWVQNVNINCSNKVVNQLLEKGARIYHAYSDETGVEVFAHFVDYQDCMTRPTLDEIAEILFFGEET